MSRKYGRRSSNLRSAGWTAAKFTGRATEKTAVGLFRWATTDHTGMSRALANMPPMGFLDTLKYTLMQFLIAVAVSILSGVWIFVLIAYGIPFLFSN